MSPQLDNTCPSSPTHYPPHQTSLLLLDYHTTFLSHVTPDPTPLLSSALKILTWARNTGVLVIHATIDPHSTPSAHIKDSQRLRTTITSMLSSNDSEHPSLLSPRASDPGMEMTFPRRVGLVSAFSSPGLLQTLCDRGVKSVVLAGISTSGCVLRSAVMAGEEGFVVTILGDACADPKAGVHEVVLGVLGNRAWVLGSDEFMEMYGGRGE